MAHSLTSEKAGNETGDRIVIEHFGKNKCKPQILPNPTAHANVLYSEAKTKYFKAEG